MIGNVPPGKELDFKDMRAGVLLEGMPGYPSTFPQLQLTPDGRFCFYNWPSNFWFSGGGANVEDKKGSHIVVGNNVPVNIAGYSLDGSPFFVDPKHVLVHMIPATEGDKLFFWNANKGKVTNTGVKCPFGGKFGKFCFSYQGKVYYQPVSPEIALWMNVQYYLDAFLYVPYNVIAPVQYGKNYADLLYDQFASNDAVYHVGVYCSGVDFLNTPDSKMKFLDYLKLGSLVVGAAALSLISYGAASPALVAALSLVVATVATASLKKAMNDYKQGRALEAASEDMYGGEENKKVYEDVPDTGGGGGSGLGIDKNILIFAGVGLVALVLLTQKKKR